MPDNVSLQHPPEGVGGHVVDVEFGPVTVVVTTDVVVVVEVDPPGPGGPGLVTVVVTVVVAVPVLPLCVVVVNMVVVTPEPPGFDGQEVAFELPHGDVAVTVVVTLPTMLVK